MKNFSQLRLVSATVILLAMLMQGCLDFPTPGNNQVPDLDPDTEDGADIMIFDLNQIFTATGTNDPNGYPFETINPIRIDWDASGSTDILLFTEHYDILGNDPGRILYFKLNGQVLRQSAVIGYDDSPVWMSEGELVGMNVSSSNWASGYTKFNLMQGWQNNDVPNNANPFNLNSRALPGLSYIPFRKFINQELYYGWIEVEATDFDDADPNETLNVKRIGISTTPGLRIRMGQG